MIRELSYQFDLDIERVYLDVNMKCDVQVWWKCGKNKIMTMNAIKLAGREKYFDVTEKLSIISKIVLENGIIRPRKSELLIILFTVENTSKIGGRTFLNLGELISPEALTAPVSKRFERILESPVPNSKIIMNIRAKYIEEISEANSNLHEISFQANNTGSSFGKSIDMTFRPNKDEQNLKQNPYRGSLMQNNTMPVRNEFSSKEKRKSETNKDWEKEKMDTPSWDRSQRQENMKNKEQEYEKPPIQMNPQRPLEFSFNPLTPADREKMGFDNTEAIRELKLIAEEKSRLAKNLQEENAKLRNQLEDKSEKSSAKSISLLNELNTVSTQKESLQREKLDLISQIEQIKEDNKRLDDKCKKLSFQISEIDQNNNDSLGKLEQKNKIIQDLSLKLEDQERRSTKLQDELFKKENEIISKDKRFSDVQEGKELAEKEKEESLRGFRVELKELQVNAERMYHEKEELKRKYEESIYKLEKSEEEYQKLVENSIKFEQEALKEREKCKFIENKFKQRESIIPEIESEFKKFSVEKQEEVRQKDEELGILREKFNSSCRKLDEVSKENESLKNSVSEKNVRIKTLEEICEQLEKSGEEKDQLIVKAKEYVSAKEEEIAHKDSEINKRDEFIQKCRTYMESKEKEYNEVVNGAKSTNNYETLGLKNDLKDKERMLEQYINDSHKNEKQIEEMTNVIDRLREKVIEYEDCMDELHRKNDSQESTLKDLVKKNLDFEIQLNIKEYEIQALKGR